MKDEWERRFMDLAFHVAQWSKDPSTKVGAVIVGKDRGSIAVGYNGFPPGIKDDDRLNVREVKYRLIQHAERNVLDNAKFNLRRATMFSTLHPCVECAKSIISRGISCVVCPPPPTREPWAESAGWAAEAFQEAGVEVRILDAPQASDKK